MQPPCVICWSSWWGIAGHSANLLVATCSCAGANKCEHDDQRQSPNGAMPSSGPSGAVPKTTTDLSLDEPYAGITSLLGRFHVSIMREWHAYSTSPNLREFPIRCSRRDQRREGGARLERCGSTSSADGQPVASLVDRVRCISIHSTGRPNPIS